jgi:hypothetical protein
MADQESELDKIRGQLNSIELRLRRLESALTYSSPKSQISTEHQIRQAEEHTVKDHLTDDDQGLESRIGRFGLAWMGNIVLLFGITFLSQYLMNLGHQILGVVIGYASSALIYYISDYLKKSNNHLSFMFKMNAQIVLFYVTLRLHFFSAEPLIGNMTLSILLLLLIVAFQVYLSVRNKSQAFATLAVLFLLSTAVMSDSIVFIMPFVIIAAAGATFYLLHFYWKSLFVVTIILAYICFLLLIIGDPVMGHPVKLITEKYLSVVCLFSLGAIYSVALFFRDKDGSDDDYLIGVTVINGILFTFLLLVVVMGFFSTAYVLLFAGITIGCLGYSIILHSRSTWNFASAFYALYGFMAMSIALYGMVGLPKVYLLLAVQSLIVVSMALWFKNRLIVIMNSLLFMTIMATYLFSANPVNGVNFSFALVALISARAINWQSSRLKIQTDIIRNLYMIEGFIMVLYALIHAVPKHFITLSWTMAALLYFLISILLKNVKYRYMALGTVICAAFYLFVVDLARIELVFRILALLFLAAISIGISIYYSNRIKKSPNDADSQTNP